MTQTIYFGTFCPKVPGLGRLPNKHFRGALGLAKIASVATLALLAVSALPPKQHKKRRCVFLLRILRFTGSLQSLCGIFHNGQLFFVHRIEHDINLFPAGTLSVELVREKELIHGNLQQGDELIESIKAWVLATVLDIHDGARGAVYKLGQVFLRPAFFLPFALDLTAQGVKIKVFVILVHSHITLYHFTFRVWI